MKKAFQLAKKPKYDKEWAERTLRAFANSYPRATYLFNKYLGIPENKPSVWLQFGSPGWYRWKKYVKAVDKLLVNGARTYDLSEIDAFTPCEAVERVLGPFWS